MKPNRLFLGAIALPLSLYLLAMMSLWLLPLSPVQAQAQVQAEYGSVPINYQRVLPSLQQAGAPLRLPKLLAYGNRRLVGSDQFFAIGGASGDQPGYSLSVVNNPQCTGALACTIAYVAAEPLAARAPIEDEFAWMREPGALDRYVEVSKDPMGWIQLANGQPAYFVPWLVGANMGYAKVIWDEGNFRYTIGLKGGAKTWVVEMANSILR